MRRGHGDPVGVEPAPQEYAAAMCDGLDMDDVDLWAGMYGSMEAFLLLEQLEEDE